jgi:hypothetical protein
MSHWRELDWPGRNIARSVDVIKKCDHLLHRLVENLMQSNNMLLHSVGFFLPIYTIIVLSSKYLRFVIFFLFCFFAP